MEELVVRPAVPTAPGAEREDGDPMAQDLDHSSRSCPPVGGDVAAPPWRSPLAPFAECPLCGGPLAPEHAHFRCRQCGWRDSCCD